MGSSEILHPNSIGYASISAEGFLVWHMIEDSHGGKVNDSRFGVRMRGEGHYAEIIRQQYRKYAEKYGLNTERWELDTTLFKRPGQQLGLF